MLTSRPACDATIEKGVPLLEKEKKKKGGTALAILSSFASLEWKKNEKKTQKNWNSCN